MKTIRVSDTSHQQLKIAAAEQRTTIQLIIERLIAAGANIVFPTKDAKS